MKKLFPAVLLLAALSLFADPVTYRDYAEKIIGTASTNGSITTYLDASGNTIGSSIQSGNQDTYRDEKGKPIGQASKNGSHTTFRDNRGRIICTATQLENQIIYRDRFGKNVGTATLDGKGGAVFRNEASQIIGYVSGSKDASRTCDAFFRIIFRYIK